MGHVWVDASNLSCEDLEKRLETILLNHEEGGGSYFPLLILVVNFPVEILYGETLLKRKLVKGRHCNLRFWSTLHGIAPSLRVLREVIRMMLRRINILIKTIDVVFG